MHRSPFLKFRWNELNVALVIACGQYRHVPSLRNPINDAGAVSRALRRRSFQYVKTVHNPTKRQLERHLRHFEWYAERARIAVVVLSGHGAEWDREPVFLPVDACAHPACGIKLSDFMEVAKMASTLGCVVADICRRESLPLPRSTRGIVSSLDHPAPIPSWLYIRSAESGAYAYDGVGMLSPFTKVFADVLDNGPGGVWAIAEEIMIRVARDCKFLQAPDVNGGIRQRNIHFGGPGRWFPWLDLFPHYMTWITSILPGSGGDDGKGDLRRLDSRDQ